MLVNRQLGHYHLLRRIGGGGMGEIYLAEDTRLQRQVAIKVIKAEANPYPDAQATQDMQRLFQREMRAITMLDHPHILPLFDFGEERLESDQLTYMVMPYRPEGSLTDWLQTRKTAERLKAAEVAHFIFQAADALQYAHGQALIHQDVKLGNFLMRNRSSFYLPDILLADFGIAKIMSATSTASQSVRGTPASMAPEQWEGTPVPATDQYALAIMAYILLAGQPPFSGRMEQVMRQHFSVQPQPPSTHNPSISRDLDSIILIALSKQPEKRFASILAFARAFQQASQPVQPSSSGWATPPSPPVNAPVTPIVDSASGPVITPVDRPTPPIAPNVYRETPVQLPPIVAPPPSFLVTSPPAQQPVGNKGRGRVFALICLAVLLIVSSVIGLGAYQGHVATVNATVTANAQGTADTQATVDAQAAQAIAANPYPSYMPGSGTIALLDPLSGEGKWFNHQDTNFGGSCQFHNGVLHVLQTTTGHFFECQNRTQFGDFALEVHISILQGDCAVVTIRDQGATLYFFEICSDGHYRIRKYTDSYAGKATILTSGNSPAINSGLGANNTVGIVARGSSIRLYVNGQFVDSINDGSYSNGYISLCASANTNSTEVAFSNIRIWT